MSHPFSEVVQGYAQLGSYLLDRWREQAATIADELDAGTYDADQATADLASTASLAAQTGFLLASEALDAAAILAGRSCEGELVCSEDFVSPVPGAPLALSGPLVRGLAPDALPVAAVSFDPSQLAAGGTHFVLCVDAAGRRAGTYRGTVDVSTPAGTAPVAPVPVWITVP